MTKATIKPEGKYEQKGRKNYVVSVGAEDETVDGAVVARGHCEVDVERFMKRLNRKGLKAVNGAYKVKMAFGVQVFSVVSIYSEDVKTIEACID